MASRDIDGPPPSVRLGPELRPVVALDVVEEGAAPADPGIVLATQLEIHRPDQGAARRGERAAVRLHRHLRGPDGARLELDRVDATDRGAGLVLVPDTRPLGCPTGTARADLTGLGLEGPEQMGRAARAGGIVETADVALAADGEGITERAEAAGMPLLQLEDEGIPGVGGDVLEDERRGLGNDRRVARVERRRVADARARLAGVVPRARVAVVARRAGRPVVEALAGAGLTEVHVTRRRRRAVDPADEQAPPRVRIGIAGRAGPLLAQVFLRTFGVVVARVHAVGVGLYVLAAEDVAGRIVRGTGVDRAAVCVGTGGVARARDGETRGAVTIVSHHEDGARHVEGEGADAAVVEIEGDVREGLTVVTREEDRRVVDVPPSSSTDEHTERMHRIEGEPGEADVL